MVANDGTLACFKENKKKKGVWLQALLSLSKIRVTLVWVDSLSRIPHPNFIFGPSQVWPKFKALVFSVELLISIDGLVW